jgi:hypothetical protein
VHPSGRLADVATPDIVGDLMVAIRDCAAAQLKARDRACDRVLLAPGSEVAWDECCDGFLYVRLVSMFPTGNPFPTPDTRPGNCKPLMIGSTIAVGVLRCAAAPDSNGNAPSAEVLTAETLGMTADASIALEAITCCVAPLTDDQSSYAQQIVLGTWTPLGPLGCVGGEWTLTIGHGQCGCPELS